MVRSLTTPMEIEHAVRSGMPLLEWTYQEPPAEYHRLVHERTRVRSMTPVVVGAGSLVTIGTVAVVNPWIGLVAAPVGLAVVAALFAADRAGVFDEPIDVSELPSFPPEVLFTSTGVVFGAFPFLWSGSEPLQYAAFVTTDWYRVDLEFRGRWGRRTLLQIPVPTQLAPHAHELADWLDAKIEGRAAPPWQTRAPRATDRPE